MGEALSKTPSIDTQLLEEAFKRFNDAGTRLETRYQELLRETELLRQELKDKDAVVKRAEKLALLGQTAAALAHEIRNPLGAIKMFLSMLKRDVRENTSALEIIQKIDKSVTSLDGVVSNILLFSKERREILTPVNLHALIRDQAEHFSMTEGKGITFDLQLSGLPFVIASEEGIRRVLFNLILNSIQAMKHNGTIMFRASTLSNGDTEVQIKDTGPGIDQSHIESVFEPFFTTRNEGTGLGLAIVRQIMSAFGGHVEASAGPGGAIVLTFPSPKKEKSV